MVYSAHYTNRFRRQCKHFRKNNQSSIVAALEDVMQQLLRGAVLGSQYRNHKLKGSLHQYYECHIAPDRLLIYRIHEEALVLEFFATGTHSQLFG